MRSEPIIAVGGVCLGPLEASENALGPIRAFGPPAADIFQPMPYSAAQSMADFLWPRGTYNYWKSSFLKEFSDDAIDVMLTFYAKAPARLSVVVIEHNGDRAWSRVPEEATAFGHRNWPYNFLITTIWTDAADTEDNIRWTREFWNAMRPFLAEAAYVNYLGETAEEDVRIAYGRKYQRLALSKRNTTLTISFT